MAGIYVHIPFCAKKCGYCDFFSVKLHKDNAFVDNFVDTIVREIKEKSYLFENQIVETIYFGGGTPSIIPFYKLQRIYCAIASCYHLSKQLECTLELNPEHATEQYFSALKDSGFVNRLSTGFQAMDESGLKYLGRNHSVSDNLRYIELSHKFGFNNFSVDYIFGYEILTEKEIERSFRFFAENNIPHISAYSLGIEENTPFMLKLKKGIIKKMDDDFYLSQFRQIHYLLQSFGYQHYEISNYCLPSMHSRHNSNYWDFVPYLGFGPSAHSYYNQSRSWNARSLSKYNEQISSGKLFSENEILLSSDVFNEYIMLKLRTQKGLNLSDLKTRFPNYFNSFEKNLARKDLIDYFEVNGDNLNLNLDGIFISDYIISEFFV